jgi:hypothetical protein
LKRNTSEFLRRISRKLAAHLSEDEKALFVRGFLAVRGCRAGARNRDKIA